MVKPKLIIASAVRIHAINVRSAAIAVRSSARSVLSSTWGSVVSPVPMPTMSLRVRPSIASPNRRRGCRVEAATKRQVQVDAVDSLKRAQPDAVRFDRERAGLEVRDPQQIPRAGGVLLGRDAN